MTKRSLTVGGLFSGIGGLELGFEQAGFEISWMLERDKKSCRVLRKRWPRAIVYQHDIEFLSEVSLERIPRVDVLVGGFPCKDISRVSTDGKRWGLLGRRSGRVFNMLEVVSAKQPRWVVIENVADGFDRWVPRVRSDLAGRRYASVPLVLSAGTFGAPHIRPRLFLVAHADCEGEPLRALHEEVAALRPFPRDRWNGHVGPAEALGVDDGLPERLDKGLSITARNRMLGDAACPEVASYLATFIAEWELEHG